MTQNATNRSRPNRKLISFTDAEWQTVEKRMNIVGASSFDQFARKVLLDGEVVVKKIAFDPSVVGAELSRIGNNINQIARQANINERATFEEVQHTRKLVQEIQGLIEHVIKEAQ